MGTEGKLKELVSNFTEELEHLVKEQLLEALQGALGGGLDLGAASAPPKRRGRPPAQKSGGGARAKGAKRSPEELAALVESLFETVKASPGLRVEQLAQEMGIATKELALPAKKLIADGRIYTEGQKRATQYFAGSGGSSRAAAKPKAAARRTRSGKKKAKAKRGGKKKSRRPKGALGDAFAALDQLEETETDSSTEEESPDVEETSEVEASEAPVSEPSPESGEQPITQSPDGRYQVTIDGKTYYAKRERDLRKRLQRA